MSQTIYLAAIVLRDGRMLLVRPGPEAPWELPGGPLLPEHDDVDMGMDAILSAMGVQAAAIEDDFVQTIFMPAEAGQVVYNIYAPTEWTGEPATAPGVGAGWFAVDEIDAIAMDERVRQAVLEAFGLREAVDDTEAVLRALAGDPGGAMADVFAPSRPPAADAMDVLRTLTGDDPEAARARVRRQFPELADDLFGLFGSFWTNPALDRRTRSLVVVAMIAALGRTKGPLQSHINGALNHGATPEQVVETLRMVAAYAGFPAATEAWPVMEAIFAERGIARPGRRE